MPSFANKLKIIRIVLLLIAEIIIRASAGFAPKMLSIIIFIEIFHGSGISFTFLMALGFLHDALLMSNTIGLTALQYISYALIKQIYQKWFMDISNQSSWMLFSCIEVIFLLLKISLSLYYATQYTYFLKLSLINVLLYPVIAHIYQITFLHEDIQRT